MVEQAIVEVERDVELLPLSMPSEQNPALVYLARLESDASRTTMADALNKIAALVWQVDTDQVRRDHGQDVAKHLYLSFPWSDLRFQHTNAIRAELIRRYAPSTVNKHLSALRGVLVAAWRLEMLDAETYQRAADIQNVKGETVPAGRSLSSGELAALMGACEADRTAAGARDASMIGLLYTCGLRRSELVKLDLAHYQADGALLVKGKRGKERLVYPTNGAVRALADWLTVRGDGAGALFVRIARGGHVQEGDRLTTQAVWVALRKRARQAKVDPVSPHDFRRTFVSDLLDAGADISTVARLAGHSRVETTARYDRRPEEAKRQASAKLHLPYVGWRHDRE
jgi:site-specific recombinase XerD